MCSDQLEDGVEVEIMWIPAHVKLEGNEIVDKRTRHAALNGAAFERPLPPGRFSGFGKICFAERVAGKVGRYRHW
jgi:hypothetical protein